MEKIAVQGSLLEKTECERVFALARSHQKLSNSPCAHECIVTSKVTGEVVNNGRLPSNLAKKTRYLIRMTLYRRLFP